MHSSGRALADVVPAAAGGSILEQPIWAATVEAAGELLLSRGIARCDVHADAFRNRPSAW